jgi:hypothetical protein
MSLKRWLWQKLTAWLVTEHPMTGMPLCDFERTRMEIRPCDVVLVEGRSHISDIIKLITQSPWTHAALYIGRLHDIENPELRAKVAASYKGDPNDQLVIESLLGEGTLINPLEKYRHLHTRLCRPKGLAYEDMQHVISNALAHLGKFYDVRQLLDLARFMFPYGVLPRRWRSSLFEHNAGTPTRTVCSSMIATAFAAVHFPILPVVQRNDDGSLKFFKRNFRLYTPRDFDYSPYFDIIKYPFFRYDELTFYRRLPWDEEGVICNDESDCYLPPRVAAPLVAMEADSQAAEPVIDALPKGKLPTFRIFTRKTQS